MCALTGALEAHLPPFERLRSHMEWTALHWRRLQESLRRGPEAAQPVSEPTPAGAYGSALYGKMEDDELSVMVT